MNLSQSKILYKTEPMQCPPPLLASFHRNPIASFDFQNFLVSEIRVSVSMLAVRPRFTIYHFQRSGSEIPPILDFRFSFSHFPLCGFHGFAWISIDSPWISQGFPWISMDFHGLAREPYYSTRNGVIKCKYSGNSLASAFSER